MATVSTSSKPVTDHLASNNHVLGIRSPDTATSRDHTSYQVPSTSTSQSIASTSAVTLDETAFSSTSTASNTATPDLSLKSAINTGNRIKEENDEDAKLLAYLAEGLSNGLHDPNTSSALDLLGITPKKMESYLDHPQIEKDESEPIQAYAKLEFPGFSYYIQTLDCTIGRRPAHMRTPALREGETERITGTKKMEGDVDVDLGLLKSISRLHVRIFYQDQPRQNSQFTTGAPDTFGSSSRGLDPETIHNQGRFVLQVLGRNGCFVDDVPVGRNSIVSLGKRTKIQIAERVFYFVLPPTPQTQKYNSDGEIGSDESMSESEEESGSLGSSDSEEESSGSSSSGEEESVEEEEEEEELEQEEALESVKDADSRKRPKLVLRKKPVPAVKGGKGKGKHQGKTIWAGKGVASAKRTKEDDDEEEEENDGDSNEGREEVETAGKKMVGKGPPKKAKAVGVEKDKNTSSDTSRKRKRGEAGEQEQQMPLKVGTPIGVEALNLKSKKKRKANVEGVDEKKEQQQDASSTSSSLATPVKGKGKGGGKAHIVAAALAAKAKTDEAKDKAKASTVTPNVKVGSTVNTSSTPRPPTTSVTPGRPGGPSPARPPVPASPLVATTGGSPLPRPVDGVVRPLYTNVRPSVIPSPVPGPHQSLSRPPAGVVTQAPRVLTGIHQGPISNVAPRPIGGTAGQAASISSTTTAPFPPSAAVFSHLTNQNPPPAVTQAAPLPPAGSGIKPELSNIDLIKNAFANPISLSRGGKLTLQEIYEDISSKHEWYRNNNRTNGRDWHSSIRHAVGNSKEMIRIPRKVNEQGKGVFYALSTSEAAKAHRLEEQNGTIQAQSASPISTPPVVTAAARPPASMSIPAPLVRPPLQPQSTPTNVAARPSPPIQPNGRVSIVIGKAPAEALAQMASVPKAAITQSIEALFGGPPIVHHEGKLFLNPLVFGDMSASEISDIGGKGAQQALAILQGHLVTHLQSKMKPGQSASPRPVRPPTLASTSTINGLQAASPRPNPSVNGATPPRPPIAVNVQMNRPPPARPGVALPSTGAQPMRPGQPSIGLSHVVRPPPSGMSSVARPQMNGTVIGQRPVARPTGGAVPTRPQPIQGQAMSPQQGRPPAATNGQTVVVTARPLQPPSTQRPPVPTIQSSAPRPVGTPATNNTTAATPVSRPIAPLNSAASSPLPRPPIARPAPASVSVQARPISTPTSTADPSKAFARANSSTLTPLVPPSSNAMMSAMQALASHPDAAGLMTLLGGGKVESGAKLTPGQLELLQRAGRIAAEQQKAQQGKRIDQSPPGKEQSIVTSHTQTSSAPSTSREDTNANPNASTDSPSK